MDTKKLFATGISIWELKDGRMVINPDGQWCWSEDVAIRLSSGEFYLERLVELEKEKINLINREIILYLTVLESN